MKNIFGCLLTTVLFLSSAYAEVKVAKKGEQKAEEELASSNTSDDDLAALHLEDESLEGEDD